MHFKCNSVDKKTWFVVAPPVALLIAYIFVIWYTWMNIIYYIYILYENANFFLYRMAQNGYNTASPGTDCSLFFTSVAGRRNNGFKIVSRASSTLQVGVSIFFFCLFHISNHLVQCQDWISRSSLINISKLKCSTDY